MVNTPLGEAACVVSLSLFEREVKPHSLTHSLYLSRMKFSSQMTQRHFRRFSLVSLHGGPKTGKLCFTACDFGSRPTDQIGTKDMRI